MGGISGPGIEPSCLDSDTAGIKDEAGAEIGGEPVDASVVANTVVGI